MSNVMEKVRKASNSVVNAGAKQMLKVRKGGRRALLRVCRRDRIPVLSLCSSRRSVQEGVGFSRAFLFTAAAGSSFARIGASSGYRQLVLDTGHACVTRSHADEFDSLFFIHSPCLITVSHLFLPY
mmetsp:Transcript_4797/g.13845  ORF Transcript_4797/g.13845 Transcript_4797/m.13845 type:complete len:126 (-) Transcript_4797:160-537(-)